MKKLMMLLAVPLVVGCYGKQVKLLKQNVLVLNGKIEALESKKQAEIKSITKKLDGLALRLNVDADYVNLRLNELQKFKSAHDKRWPNLVPKEKP